MKSYDERNDSLVKPLLVSYTILTLHNWGVYALASFMGWERITSYWGS